MKNKLHDEIDKFFETWDAVQIVAFLRDLQPIFELYDVESEEEDWVRQIVSPGEHHQIRLIRTVYLVSKLAEFHSGKLATIKILHKDLWKKMEKEAMTLNSDIKES